VKAYPASTAPEHVMAPVYVPGNVLALADETHVGFVVNVVLGLTVYVSVGTLPPNVIDWFVAVMVSVAMGVTVIWPATYAMV